MTDSSLVSEAPHSSIRAIDLHFSIDKNQVNWPQLGHTNGHHSITDLLKVKCIRSRRCGATVQPALPCRSQRRAHTRSF